jgi:hypothetical protein
LTSVSISRAAALDGVYPACTPSLAGVALVAAARRSAGVASAFEKAVGGVRNDSEDANASRRRADAGPVPGAAVRIFSSASGDAPRDSFGFVLARDALLAEAADPARAIHEGVSGVSSLVPRGVVGPPSARSTVVSARSTVVSAS